MKTSLLLIAALLVGADDDQAKKDLESMQGNWKLVSLEIEGKKQDKPQPGSMTIKGNKLTHPGEGGKVEEGTFTLDPTKKPKAMDMKSSSTTGKEMSISAIYSIEGDTLKLCLGKKDRPTEFKAAKDNVLLVFERDKK